MCFRKEKMKGSVKYVPHPVLGVPIEHLIVVLLCC